MIKNAELGKELAVSVSNKIGILANIAKIMADHGINIEGMVGYTMNNEAMIMLVADDTLRAKEALMKGGYKTITENEVVVVDMENKPGALKIVTAKLAAEKIDIKYTYGTASSGAAPARIIFATSDNEKALISFKGR